MAKVRIEFDTDNDAFSGCDLHEETARVLNDLAECIVNGRFNPGGTILRDINGNRIGMAEVTGNLPE